MTRLIALGAATAALLLLGAAWASPDRGVEATVLVVDATPATATNVINTDHTVTATVSDLGSPMQGVTVEFSVTSGPNAGDTGSDVTDVNGQATFTYNGNSGPGQDSIDACVFSLPGPFRPLGGGTPAPLACDTVTKDWVQPTPTPSPTPSPSPGATLAAGTATPSPSPTGAPVSLPGTGGDTGPGPKRPLAAMALLSLLVVSCAVGTALLRRAR